MAASNATWRPGYPSTDAKWHLVTRLLGLGRLFESELHAGQRKDDCKPLQLGASVFRQIRRWRSPWDFECIPPEGRARMRKRMSAHAAYWNPHVGSKSLRINLL